MLAPTIFITHQVNSRCYSCAGTCYSEPCNCQMGSCESDYCFIERRPTDERDYYRITKGCIKRPPRTHMGCDYDRFQNHILCICRGEFCNDMIYIRPMHRQTITCRNCSDREPDCGEICRGQWCHEDSTTGAAGCGYGPPSLPYFYKGPELLYYRTRMCVTVSRGSSSPRKHCICNTNNCNVAYKRSTPWNHLEGASRIRSLFVNPKESNFPSELHRCVNCELSTQDIRMTASCKQNQCMGHYCTFATQRLFLGTKQYRQQKSILNERQGCINVTDNHHIQLGCSHKWMSNEGEELYCACIGDRCNRDLATASLNKAIRITIIINELITVIFIHLIICPNLLS
ncbi:hypothetical protein ACH3XW_35265 [Acanthocheilonema viteae]